MSTNRAIERTQGFMSVVGPIDAAAEARKQSRARPIAPPDGKTEKVVAIYVCPHPACDDYYGAAGMGDLDDKKTHPPTEHVAAHEQSTGRRHLRSRSVCPSCLTSNRKAPDGGDVVRVRVNARVLV